MARKRGRAAGGLAVLLPRAPCAAAMPARAGDDATPPRGLRLARNLKANLGMSV